MRIPVAGIRIGGPAHFVECLSDIRRYKREVCLPEVESSANWHSRSDELGRPRYLRYISEPDKQEPAA